MCREDGRWMCGCKRSDRAADQSQELAGWPRQGRSGRVSCPRTTKKKLLQKQTGALCCSILLHTQLLNRILSAVSSAIEPK